MRTVLLIVAPSKKFLIWRSLYRSFRRPIYCSRLTPRPAVNGLRFASTRCPSVGDQSMWKRDEAVRPAQTTGSPSPSPAPEIATPRAEPTRHSERDMVNIGKSVIIKGELSGSEDLTIEGQVEGK